MPDVVRHAVRAELDELEDTLTEAFVDDPWMAWMYPGGDDPANGPAAFLRAMLDIGFPHGHVYTLGAHNDAVAIWSPPDVALFDDAGVARIGPVFEAMGEWGAEVGARLLDVSAAHPHNRGPHFYLSVLGTRASAQGKGLGSVLMRSILDQCDRQGLGVYLESSNIRNVPFYERHGFEVLAEIEMTEGVAIRPMWREPRVS